MTISYSVFKPKFRKTIADSVYQEVTSKTALYYHWFGKENPWTDFLSPFIGSSSGDYPGPPSNNFRYDLHVRRDILTTKLIKPSDISYVVRRINWESGKVFDMYDDSYGPPSADPASAIGYYGAENVEDAEFFVLTSDYNVYKCIWNNSNAASTVMPTSTSEKIVTLADGYKWKFLYSIPVALRNRFLTNDYMPVSTALKSAYYSSGTISNIFIQNGGVGYNSATTTATITGDGYKESNPFLLSGITINAPLSGSTGGSGYLHNAGELIAPINATSVLAGNVYTILSVGSTDFTSIGAVSNTSYVASTDTNITFRATASGTGSGTVGFRYKIVSIGASFGLSGVSIIDTTGGFTCNTPLSALDVGQTITFSGTKGGSATFSSYPGTSTYKVSAVSVATVTNATSVANTGTSGTATITWTVNSGTPSIGMTITGSSYIPSGTTISNVTGSGPYTVTISNNLTGNITNATLLASSGTTNFTITKIDGTAITTAAGSLSGLSYTCNSTDFTTFGAPDNNVNTVFIPTTAGWGNGTASLQPSVIVDYPFPSATNFVANSVVSKGQLIRVINSATEYYYQVTSGTKLGVSAPTQTQVLKSETNGSCQLKYVGKNARATAPLNSSTYDSLDISSISSTGNSVITVNDAGLGYQTGTPSIYKNYPRYNYYSSSSKLTWTTNTVMVAGNIVSYSEQKSDKTYDATRYYRVILGGNTGTLNTATAGTFVSGRQYTVASLGTTDFTAAGATASFTANTMTCTTSVMTISDSTGTITAGTYLSGTANITPSTTITSQVTPLLAYETLGGDGRYNISGNSVAVTTSQTVKGQPAVGTKFIATALGTGTGTATYTNAPTDTTGNLFYSGAAILKYIGQDPILKPVTTKTEAEIKLIISPKSDMLAPQFGIVRTGTKYSEIPSVNIGVPGGGGTTATVTASIGTPGQSDEGQVINLVLVDGGNGYTASPSITISNPKITFDPTVVTSSSNGYVDVTNETITYNAHKFVTGDPVIYNSGGGTSIGGLSSSTIATSTVNSASFDTAANVGSKILTATTATGTILPGSVISGAAGIPANTYVVAINGTTIYMSAATTAAVTNASLTFTGNTYYIIRDSANTIKLANSLSNALAGTYVGLSTGATFVNNHFLQLLLNKETATAIGSLGTGGEIVGYSFVDQGIGYTNANIQISDTNSTRKFDGATAVDPSTDLITVYANDGVSGHGLSTGTAVVYTKGSSAATLVSNSSIGGLTSGATYYVIYISPFTIKLATTAANATTGTAIDITADGTGTDHVFTIPTAGTGAILVADFDYGNVETLQANVELLAVPGSIEAIKIVNGGQNYSSAVATILGDGNGATATVTCSGGKVTALNITNPGAGYSWVDIKIVGNIGSDGGAIARAIMSPLGGHGSNAIDELNANSLVFYTSISRDINQGIEITNDYRKVGLIRNLKQFGSNRRFTEDIGSGCVLVEGVFDKAQLVPDMLLYKVEPTGIQNYKKYRIVDFNDTQILLSVFNNFTLQAGDQLITDPTDIGHIINPTEKIIQFTVTKAYERSIDQFSGDFLFFSVREPYAPSADQIVTVRTKITL